MTEEERRRRQAFNSGPAAGTLRIVGTPAENPGMPSGTGAMTVYQQALAAQPQQRETLYSPDRWWAGDLDTGFRISDNDTDRETWGQISKLYRAGDTEGALALLRSAAGKSGMTGFYNDDGTYTGMVRGYKADANGSYQPVVGGQAMWTGDPETNIWLKPDGTTFTSEGGVLQDSDTTWSRTKPAPVWTPRTWSDVRNENGLTWGDTFAIKAAHGDFTNPELNTPEGNARKLAAMFEQPLGMPDENWEKKVSGYDPDYVAELAAAAGTGERGQQPGSSAPGENTLWQTYLAKYAGGEAPRWTGGAYDPETDTLWQRYLAQFDGAEAPEWQGTDYARIRDAATERAAVPFVYELERDPVWQAYRKQYLREGARAGEDTLGRYAAMTGGVPSTAAMTAAQQASGNYAARLTDKIPELYQQAYQRYLQEYRRQLDLAGAYDDYDQASYDRYRDELDQWNRDRSFAYDAARDSQAAGRKGNETAYSRYLDELDQWNRDRSFAYTRERDAVSDRRYDAEWAQKLREYADSQNWKAAEWEQYLREYGDELSQAEREWVYRQQRDAVEDARYADTQQYERTRDEQTRQRQAALDERDAEDAAYARLMNAAKLAAQYGDYSGLAALGISPNAENLRRLAIAEAGRVTPVGSGGARSGGSSGGSSGSASDGSSGGGGETEDYATSTVNAAYRAYLNGDRSDLTMRILESAGLVDAEGIPDEGDPESMYSVMDRVLADMQAKGRPWKQLQRELDAELRDERITREEYEALWKKYVSKGLEDGVRNQTGVVHRDGSPMSAGFTGVWQTVRDLADRGEREKALETMSRAYEAGSIHEYEIDVMMDQLGW